MATSQDLATQALRRWSELRAQGIACRERLQDLELQKLERELDAIRAEMAPVRQCIDRR
jgi:formate dehydrogenase maturation protein FdhE